MPLLAIYSLFHTLALQILMQAEILLVVNHIYTCVFWVKFFVSFTALKVTQISEEDEDYEDISFDSYDAEAVKEISPIYETIFDSKMTNLVCPVPADEFGDYVARCHSNENNDFKAQFAV